MRVLAAILLLAACGSKDGPYSGTIVVGSDYVQVLATAKGDRGCPPRIQRPGTCVRTPPAPGHECSSAPACVTEVSISASGKRAGAKSSFVPAPWLAEAEGPLTIEVTGCGGRQVVTVELAKQPAPFESATAKVAGDHLEFGWSPAAGDNVCGLWRWPDGVEVCCSGGREPLRRPVSGVTDARLSRGVLLKKLKNLEVYRTVETGNLLE